jgi:Na+/H+ antiporter NhaD/arsenite permease-like protein
MTQPESFDKDIELARIQVDVSIWTAVLSVCLTFGFTFIGGAPIAMIAYILSYPNHPITFTGYIAMTLAVVLGTIMVVQAKREDDERRKKWKAKFDRLSKLAKAEKQG